MVDPGAIVRQGFDELGERYLTWQLEMEVDPRQPYLGQFMDELPDGARVLDLGCGPGVPAAQMLAERFEVTAVDYSSVQIGIARAQVPSATFIEADLAEVEFSDGSFDGAISLFAIDHVPRAEHLGLFRRVAGWLGPSGLFLVSIAAGERDDVVHEWGGVRMYSSSYDAEKTRRLLRDAGFQPIVDEVVLLPEGVRYLWVLARA